MTTKTAEELKAEAEALLEKAQELEHEERQRARKEQRLKEIEKEVVEKIAEIKKSGPAMKKLVASLTGVEWEPIFEEFSEYRYSRFSKDQVGQINYAMRKHGAMHYKGKVGGYTFALRANPSGRYSFRRRMATTGKAELYIEDNHYNKLLCWAIKEVNDSGIKKFQKGINQALEAIKREEKAQADKAKTKSIIEGALGRVYKDVSVFKLYYRNRMGSPTTEKPYYSADVRTKDGVSLTINNITVDRETKAISGMITVSLTQTIGQDGKVALDTSNLDKIPS